MSFPRSKIVALNAQSGGGSRVAAICQFLGRHEPDVVVLTEWREGANGRKFMDWAQIHGLGGKSRNGSRLPLRRQHGQRRMCRVTQPFHSETMTPPAAASAGVLMLARFLGWTLLACYFPQRETKARFFTHCADLAAAYAHMPFAMIGDLNTGNQLADKTLAGAPFACDSHFDELTKEGLLVDLWRHTNGADARQWSWHSSKNGFRIDHAFANRPFFELFQPSCVYDHRPREERISDHSALIITRRH